MNYRELLKKYIEHVAECEGITFLRDQDRYDSLDVISDDEWAELQTIDSEEVADRD